MEFTCSLNIFVSSRLILMLFEIPGSPDDHSLEVYFDFSLAQQEVGFRSESSTSKLISERVLRVERDTSHLHRYSTLTTM